MTQDDEAKSIGMLLGVMSGDPRYEAERAYMVQLEADGWTGTGTGALSCPTCGAMVAASLDFTLIKRHKAWHEGT